MGLDHDPQDKRFWISAGAAKERDFVERILPALGLTARINAEKAHNPYAPDLLVDGRVAELKCQRTPFFRAWELFGIDPQYAVTFNRNDFQRYREGYPSIDIYFWIDWFRTSKRIGGEAYRVSPMAGVWRAPFPQIRRVIESPSVRSHEYVNRLLDELGNARESFVLDVRQFELLSDSQDVRDVGGWAANTRVTPG